MKKRVAAMWPRLVRKLGLNQINMWTMATGPASATICALFEVGWEPVSPTRWFANGKEAIVDGAAFNKAHILAQAEKDLIKKLWAQGSAHANSSGIEQGALLHPAKRAKAALAKEGLFSAAKAVDFLVCGAVHDPQPDTQGERAPLHPLRKRSSGIQMA